jgi:calcyphosin
MDDSGDGQLDEYEFKKAIHDYGIEVDPKDLSSMFKAIDTDHSGSISYNEFIRAVKGPMN